MMTKQRWKIWYEGDHPNHVKGSGKISFTLAYVKFAYSWRNLIKPRRICSMKWGEWE